MVSRCTFQIADHEQRFGLIKQTNRKHIKWATFWYKNEDNSLNVYNNIFRKGNNGIKKNCQVPSPVHA